jgi:hypothetical protein
MQPTACTHDAGLGTIVFWTLVRPSPLRRPRVDSRHLTQAVLEKGLQQTPLVASMPTRQHR